MGQSRRAGGHPHLSVTAQSAKPKNLFAQKWPKVPFWVLFESKNAKKICMKIRPQGKCALFGAQVERGGFWWMF